MKIGLCLSFNNSIYKEILFMKIILQSVLKKLQRNFSVLRKRHLSLSTGTQYFTENFKHKYSCRAGEEAFSGKLFWAQSFTLSSSPACKQQGQQLNDSHGGSVSDTLSGTLHLSTLSGCQDLGGPY